MTWGWREKGVSRQKKQHEQGPWLGEDRGTLEALKCVVGEEDNVAKLEDSMTQSFIGQGWAFYPNGAGKSGKDLRKGV